MCVCVRTSVCINVCCIPRLGVSRFSAAAKARVGKTSYLLYLLRTPTFPSSTDITNPHPVSAEGGDVHNGGLLSRSLTL